MYYHKDLEPLEIATCLDLTECEIDQVRAEKVGLLKGMLAAQIGLPELPASFHKPGDVEGIGALVNSLREEPLTSFLFPGSSQSIVVGQTLGCSARKSAGTRALPCRWLSPRGGEMPVEKLKIKEKMFS